MSALEDVVAGLTVADLARFAKLSIADIVALVLQPKVNGEVVKEVGPAVKNGAPGKKAKKAGRRPAVADTPAVAGAAPYDEKLFVFLTGAGGPVSATEVRTAVGGSPAEVRAALHRLRDAGRVRTRGQRRATRYSAVGW